MSTVASLHAARPKSLFVRASALAFGLLIALAWAATAFVGTLLTPLSRRLGRKLATLAAKSPQTEAQGPPA